MNLPLISPLSRKYYQYASEVDERIHHRAIDVRVCLEKVCDSIVIQLVSTQTKNKWKDISLHNKIQACKEFMDNTIVDKVLNAKVVGNNGAHKGEEAEISTQDIDDALEAIKLFSLEIFYSFFVKNGFGDLKNGSWVPTVFSTLPPIYRVEILKKYYIKEPSSFVIDKLSKAYLKSGMKKEGLDFLDKCWNNKEINKDLLELLKHDLVLLEQNFDRLKVANNLEEAKENFNRLLPAINEDERDVFVCLISMILTGQ